MDEASDRASKRLEKPGPAREPQNGQKTVVVPIDDPNWFKAYSEKHHAHA